MATLPNANRLRALLCNLNQGGSVGLLKAGFSPTRKTPVIKQPKKNKIGHLKWALPISFLRQAAPNISGPI
jgi:hypothetical protein